MENSFTYKALFIISGGVFVMLQDISMLVLVCTIAVIFDCVSAIRLAKRVKKNGDGKGKIESRKGLVIIDKLSVIYSLIVFGYLIDTYIATMFNLYLPNIVAGIFCFWNFWSILENESSLKDARWAKIMQRILVDKAERHFDIDLKDFKEKQK